MSMSRKGLGDDWIKVDLHIHTVDDPKDVIDYSALQLLERARELGFGVLAITLHDAVFDRPEVFAAAADMGILLIPAAEMRLEGADVIILNVTAAEVERLRSFADLRQLRSARGDSIFTIAPHPFYLLGGSIGRRLIADIDCFDGIEQCHFHKGPFNPNRRAARVARKFKKPMIATSDAHRLHAFGRHYVSIPRAAAVSCESVFHALRHGPMKMVSPACTMKDFCSAVYWVFVSHPLQVRQRRNGESHRHHHATLEAR